MIGFAEVTTADSDLVRGCRNSTQLSFLSGAFVWHCATSTRNFLHLAALEFHHYLPLHELLCEQIGSLNPAHKNSNGSGLIVVFLNQDMLANPTVILHHDESQTNIARRFDVNSASIKRFQDASYDD